MKSVSRIWVAAGSVCMIASALALSGCSIDKKTAPAVTGPSEFGLSVTLTADRDQLPPDGVSKAFVTISARDYTGAAKAGQSFTIAKSGGPSVSVSPNQVTTDGNGLATVVVTAPPPTASGGTVTLSATPIGTNFANDVARTVTIRIVGPVAPVPSFTAPSNATAGDTAVFDASGTTSDGVACGSACTYTWNLQDPTGTSQSRTGIVVAQIVSAGPWVVTLTVRDTTTGLQATKTQVMTVAAASSSSSSSSSSTGP